MRSREQDRCSKLQQTRPLSGVRGCLRQRRVKGILLAGGTGSRLHPLTLAVNKHLLPVAGTPMIFYPLALLLRAGVRDLLIVTTPRDRAAFEDLLGDGGQWGITIAYAEQQEPSGVPRALALAREWSAGQRICVLLGDNIFVGDGLAVRIRQAWQSDHGAQIFSCVVSDPRSYGVVITPPGGEILCLEEKPTNIPVGARAIPGLYVYGPQVFTAIDEMTAASERQADVTDIHRWFWARGRLAVEPLSTDIGWCDAGTHETLAQATRMVEQEESRTGRMVACLEEIAWAREWITDAQIRLRLPGMSSGRYAEYVRRTLAKGRSAIAHV